MDDLECDICCERYDDEIHRPRVLPCGHTFCSECITKELTDDKRICATCRTPHRAKSIVNLKVNVTVERLIRNFPKSLSMGTKSNDSEEDKEDDYSRGRCSTHKKSDIYFYCETHSVKVCRECTVIEHPVSKCKIISSKQQIEKINEVVIQKASLTVATINDTLSTLTELVQENDGILSRQEFEIQQYNKKIEDARKTIARVKTASEKAHKDISRGIERRNHLETAKQNLQNAKTKKTMDLNRNSIQTVSRDITKWLQDVSSQVKVVPSAPTSILESLSNGKTICVEKTLDGKKLTASLLSTGGKLHLHPFKNEFPNGGATVLQYAQVLSHLPIQPPNLLFLDLTYNKSLQGRLYVKLEVELHDFIKHIPALVTGESGKILMENECCYTSGCPLAILSEENIDDIPSRKLEAPSVESGTVLCNFSGSSIYAIFVFFGCKTNCQCKTIFNNSSFAKIGHVVSGQEIAKVCKDYGISKQAKIKITDCGLVLEI